MEFKKDKKFKIMQITDMQEIPAVSPDTTALIEAAVEAEKPDLVVLTGDLSFNGEKGSHQKLAQKLEQLREKNIQVAVIPGNHDIDNIYTKGYGQDDYFDVDNINAKDFQDIYQNLGYHLATSKHDESLSYRIDLNRYPGLPIIYYYKSKV